MSAVDEILIEEGNNNYIDWSHKLIIDNDEIQYHQIVIIKKKSVSVLGETENEVWVDIEKKNLNNKSIQDLEKFLKSQDSDERFDKFKSYLDKNNIKFKKGDWQSFDNIFINDIEDKEINPVDKPTKKLDSEGLKKAVTEGFALGDLTELSKIKIRFIEDRKKLTPEQLSNYKVSDLEKKVDKEMEILNKKAFPKNRDTREK